MLSQAINTVNTTIEEEKWILASLVQDIGIPPFLPSIIRVFDIIFPTNSPSRFCLNVLPLVPIDEQNIASQFLFGSGSHQLPLKPQRPNGYEGSIFAQLLVLKK